MNFYRSHQSQKMFPLGCNNKQDDYLNLKKMYVKEKIFVPLI